MSFCKFKECGKYAIFGSETDKYYCKKHKSSDMVDIINKKCEFDGCVKNPLFNYKGLSKRFCNEHKLKEMVNVVHRYCITEGCFKQASFNIKGKYANYCFDHKTKQMELVLVKSKCKDLNCDISPSYNYPNKKGTIYCAKHKLEGMVCKNKKCEFEGCFISSRFNFIDEKLGRFCAIHKHPDMIDVKSLRCLAPLCYTKGNKKYQGYCLRCFIFTFPDKPVCRNYKTKEKAVCDFITLSFPEYSFINDKKISDGCSKRRPDLLLDLGYQIIIIEIDENQHDTYESSCENKRLMEISKDLGHRPIVLLRFNPDNYILNGNKITSCWGLNGKGILNIKKNKQKEWNSRLETLREQVIHCLKPENKTEKTLEIINLFFN